MAFELDKLGVPCARQVPFLVSYKGAVVGESRLDLIVADKLIVELKAVEGIVPLHVAQTLAYLRITRIPLGLIINFNVPVLLRGVRRVAL